MGRPSTYDPATETKCCGRCEERKALDDFAKDANGQAGRRSWCRACEAERGREYRARPGAKDRRAEYARRWRERRPEYFRELRLRQRYGLRLADYEAMLVEQGGVCAICGGDPDDDHGFLHVDHDAETGKVRGLLCGCCNRAIGLLDHDSERLRAAARYMEERG